MARNTVYVVGAGASFEADLPVGKTLKDEIARILKMEFDYGSFKDGNYDLYQTLRHYANNDSTAVSEYLQVCRHIRNNMPLAISIDNFIDSERGNEKLALCGKIAIVDAILKSEKKSRLYFERHKGLHAIRFSELENTWYLPFFRTLTENCRVGDLAKRFSSITLVIFNYDRCLEHFLHNALMTYYRLPEADAAELISSLTIIHPYGTVGSLQWQDHASSTHMEYGGVIQTSQLIAYAERIRTFTEGAHSEPIEKLKSKMKHTERLVFLGFAFHRLNMELLSLTNFDRYENPSPIACYATAFETSKSDRESISSSITHLYQGELSINIENMTCSQLFRDYSRSLGYA